MDFERIMESLNCRGVSFWFTYVFSALLKSDKVCLKQTDAGRTSNKVSFCSSRNFFFTLFNLTACDYAFDFVQSKTNIELTSK